MDKKETTPFDTQSSSTFWIWTLSYLLSRFRMRTLSYHLISSGLVTFDFLKSYWRSSINLSPSFLFEISAPVADKTTGLDRYRRLRRLNCLMDIYMLQKDELATARMLLDRVEKLDEKIKKLDAELAGYYKQLKKT